MHSSSNGSEYTICPHDVYGEYGKKQRVTLHFKSKLLPEPLPCLKVYLSVEGFFLFQNSRVLLFLKSILQPNGKLCALLLAKVYMSLPWDLSLSFFFFLPRFTVTGCPFKIHSVVTTCSTLMNHLMMLLTKLA